MLKLKRIHHVAIICSDYQRSKHFYTVVLGMQVLAEHYRAERNSWKLDLAIAGQYAVELFSFPDPPARPSQPEAQGLRHIAFAVDDIDETVNWLTSQQVIAEPVRTDEFTGKRFTFIADPDNLPVEFYEL